MAERHVISKGQRVRGGLMQRAERRHAYLLRRAAGETYEQIAEAMHVSPSTVRRVVMRHLEGLAREDDLRGKRVVEMELARLQELDRILWDEARDGSFAAIDRILKV